MMFCSTIIPTVGRTKLERAVCSVLEQSFNPERFEIIIVNDSGRPLPYAAWHDAPQVAILNTQRRERCFARNCGASAARGAYLHFLDDDDWMAPGFLNQFETLAQREESAVWLYGATQLVDRDGSRLIQLQHGLSGNCFTQVMAGEWIPLQASLIRADSFFALGGFHPLIPGGEDVDLLRRAALRGDVAELDALVTYIEMGTTDSTTNYGQAVSLTRWAREAILNEPGVFARLRASALTAGWNGRMVRLFLTSAVWNARAGRPGTAAGRLLSGARASATAGTALFDVRFWQSLTRPYESDTFLKGFESANLSVGKRSVTPS